MKRAAIALAFVVATAGLKACATTAATTTAATPTVVAQPFKAASDPDKEKRLEWFREAKYGLFIHWGLYALPAGQWNGKRSLGLGEWVMFRSRVPGKDYENLASRFKPVKFNADEWVKVAKDAGMKRDSR